MFSEGASLTELGASFPRMEPLTGNNTFKKLPSIYLSTALVPSLGLTQPDLICRTTEKQREQSPITFWIEL